MLFPTTIFAVFFATVYLSFNERALPLIQNIVLPVGISFYTFQAIAYISDVASGKCKPAKSFIDFANYLAFFPKLAAGPIARPADLIPQMEMIAAQQANR